VETNTLAISAEQAQMLKAIWSNAYRLKSGDDAEHKMNVKT